MKEKMEKRLTRHHKTIIAEVFKKHTLREGTVQEIIIDWKEFNGGFLDAILCREPTDATYQEANKWADEVINLHIKYTES